MKKPIEISQIGVDSTKKATGPRSGVGKERSSRNSIKHGIFAGTLVLKGESLAKYHSLLAELFEDIQPVGILERLLVEEIAVNRWRLRRCIQAERAEIQRTSDFQDVEELESPSLSLLASRGDDTGLIEKIADPKVCDYCLRLLRNLRKRMEYDGFAEERDTSILRKVYGGSSRVFDTYARWLNPTPEEKLQRERCASCKRDLLYAIDEDIQRLEECKKKRQFSESDRTKVEILRRRIPEAPVLNSLIRRESQLGRLFDRTLSQLERTQRLRRGQPVTPRIEVNVSR
jgi:hypothetical protein